MDEIEQSSIESPNTDLEFTSTDHKDDGFFEISGFWRRIFAFIIDLLILSVPLIILGFIFRDIAFSLGPWGRFVGYGIFFVYLTYFNSGLGGGQTIGKRIMKIAVVDSDGGYLPVSKAMLRALVLVLIGILNGWVLPILENPIVVIFSYTIIFGGGLALIYGLIFNRKTRQGIHDLIVSSYVVNTPTKPGVVVPAIPRIHKRITYGLVVLGLVLGLAGFFLQGRINPTFGIIESEAWEEIDNLHTILSEDDQFYTVNVHRSIILETGTSKEWKDLDIEVWVKKSCSRDQEYCDALLDQIAHTAFEKYDGINNLTGMRITLVNRFDLGLANGNLSRSAALTIENWRRQLELE
jgi:uncharacterized RDD family membrane protein YckC